MRVRYLDSVLVEADFQNLVSYIALHFPAHVRHVQTEDYRGSVSLAGIRGLEQTHGSTGHEGR